MGIRDNLQDIWKRLEEARRNAPHPQSVVLVGVTKGVPPERIKEAIASGLEVLGENRVQEAEEKVKILGHGLPWHMVGHLQRNKVRGAIQLFELIHSIDTLSLALAIEKEARRLNKVVPILLQVKLHEKETQFGVNPDAAGRIAKEIATLHHVKLMGLMAIAPLSEDPETSRPYFRRLRELKEILEEEKNPRIDMRYLSMGMSHDFEVAVEEGSNMVRIGRALFG